MFKDRLKTARQNKRLSQREVANMLYISQQAYAKYETGAASPNPDMLSKIAEILGASVDELIGRQQHNNTVNRIKELRKSRGMSQQELAQILDVHQTAISQWETGKTSPDINSANRLASLFGVSIEQLFGLEKKNDLLQKQTSSIIEATELSNSECELIELVKSLTEDEIKELSRFVDYIISRRD